MKFLTGKCVIWACALLTGWTTQCVAVSTTPSFLAGCEPDYPPYCMVTGDGQASGFSVELLRATLKAVGHEVTFKTGPWSDLKQELANGRLRVLPLVGRTPEREAVYDFTFPYLTMHGVIMIRNDRTGIHSPSDLKGKRVAVLRGDNAEEFLHRVNLGAVVVPRPSSETALRELAEGKHDAVVIQKLLAFQLMQKTGLKNLRTAGPPLKEFIQSFCFAVRKGDKDLLADLNEGLAIVMADGTFRALYAKWFTELEELGRTKTRIVIGGDENCPPYEFLDQNKQPAGFNVDLTRAIARHMELSVDIRLGSWSLIRKGLESGDIDVVQSMFYSAEREQAYDFSPPHTPLQYVIATRKGSPELSGMESLAGKTILVMAGDIMEDTARSKGYGMQLVTAGSQEEALRLLSLGKHDCALVAKVPALYWIKKNGWHNLRVSDHPVLAAECCYAVRSGNQSLLAQFSEGLAAVKETGDYRRIQSKWLTPYDPAGFNFRTVITYLLAVALPLLLLLGAVLLWSRSLQRKVSERTRELHEEMTEHKRAEERAQAALAETQRLLKDADNSRRALLSVIEDQKIAEDRLRNSEEKFRSLYDSMKEGVALHRLLYDPSGRAVDYVIESVNPAYETLVGLKASDVTGQKASTVYGMQTAPYLDVYASVAETGKPVRFEILFEPMGKSFLISVTTPSKGRFATVFEDITERKKAEVEHKRLMTAIEQSGEAIVITDPNGNIQYVNPAFVAVRGYSLDEVVGQNLRIFKSGQQDEAFYRELWETLSSGKTWTGRFINKRKDGTLYTEEATISPVCDENGKIINYVSASRDITAHLHLSAQLQQAQKMESVGRLAGGVAHDFNNMLSVILGNTELALNGMDPTHPLFADLQEIRKAAERSAALTRQLLAFARKQTVSPKAVNLNAVLAEMIAMLRRLIGEDIDLVWKPCESLWPVKVDTSQISQILANLAINARDAMKDVGKLTIETRNTSINEVYCFKHAEAVPGDYVLLAVSDDGCGMDKNVLGHLFEPFFTTKSVGTGTGLGLATVYGIVKQNRGFINVYSEPGQGTTFTIYLPRHLGKVERTLVQNDTEPLMRGQETVLLLEDEPEILRVGETMLGNLGYQVLTATLPDEAIRLAEKHAGTIDLLLTDVVMPEMNGRDLSKRLTTLIPNLKCLFMSGYTANVIAHQGVLDEGVHFIQKPFSMKELATKVREALDNR